MAKPTLAAIRAALADRRRWRRWAIEALLLILVLAAVSAWQTSGLASGTAPPLAGLRSDGSRVKLMPGQSAKLVVFWATWCKVCKANVGTLEAIARDWPVITVAMQSGELEEVAEFLDERGLTVPALADDDSDIAEAWGVRMVPTYFVVDARNQIRFRVVGYTTAWGLRARLAWAQYVPLN